MKSVPVLLITHDDLLWQRWRELDPERWLVAARAAGRPAALARPGPVPGRAGRRSAAAAVLAGRRLGADPGRPQPVGRQRQPPRRTGHPGPGRGRPRLLPQLRPPQALAQALEVISTGGIWMGRSLVSRLLRLVAEKGQDAGDWDGGLLTERTAARCGRRLGHAQIAEALGITERTVKAHLSAVSRNWACPTACSWRCWCTAFPRLANPAAKSS